MHYTKEKARSRKIDILSAFHVRSTNCTHFLNNTTGGKKMLSEYRPNKDIYLPQLGYPQVTSRLFAKFVISLSQKE